MLVPVDEQWRKTPVLVALEELSNREFQYYYVSYHTRELPDVQLDSEKAEGPDIKLPTSPGSQKKQWDFK